MPTRLGAPSTAATDSPVYKGWTKSRLYEVDRVISAEIRDEEWYLQVLWKGYNDPTPEKEEVIVDTVQDPTILSQIRRCKLDYMLLNPAQRRFMPGTVEDDSVEINGVHARSSLLDILYLNYEDYTAFEVYDICCTLSDVANSAHESCLALVQLHDDDWWVGPGHD